MAFTAVTRTGHYRQLDGVTPATGHITVALSQELQDSSTQQTIVPSSQSFILDGTGSFSGTFVATDDPTTTPTGGTYTITERIDGASQRVYTVVFSHAQPSQDLSQIAPATNVATYSYMLATNNLSDVTSPTAARANLGLGGAATLASAAVLQTTNNLSDVASVTTAKTNLGLIYAALHPYDVTNATYGAKADAQCRADGAITSGSAVLTGSGFVAGDVGKVVVVARAGAAGAALVTTVAGYTSATSVTLAATAGTSVASGAIYTYGADDTTAIQGALNAAAAVHGTVYLASTPALVTATLSVPDSLTIAGAGCYALYGSYPVSGVITLDMPTTAPYLTGSVLVIATANADALHLNVTGRSVHLRDFGIRFAGHFQGTGHGILARGAAIAGGYDNGPMESSWQSISVYGHDAGHYAYWVTNPLYNTFAALHGYGGGGIVVEQNAPAGIYYGNTLLAQNFFMVVVAGTAHGIYYKNTTAHTSAPVLMTTVRTQASVADHSAFTGLAAPTSAQRTFTFDSGGGTPFGLSNLGLDLESNVGSPITQPPSIGWFVDSGSYLNNLPDGSPIMGQLASGAPTNVHRYIDSGFDMRTTSNEPTNFVEGLISGSLQTGPLTDGTGGLSIANSHVYFGSGAPGAIGSNGDIYFNTAGGSGTTIYQKRSGAWAGIV